MSLGIVVGLGPGDVVLDGNPAPPKKHSPQFSFRFSFMMSKISAKLKRVIPTGATNAWGRLNAVAVAENWRSTFDAKRCQLSSAASLSH